MALPPKIARSSICNGQNQLSQQSEEYISQPFDEFCTANTFKTILKLFEDICCAAGITTERSHLIYNLLKLNIKSWKAQNVWSKLDKKMSGWEYADGTACVKTKVLVIGCGPCGLRVAIEAALLGCKVVVLEKRDGFTRNNVLHLWPFLIHDLKSLGAKHFFGKFCSGSIDHISIRTLQCILLKVALILGVEVHASGEFISLREPKDPTEGWRAQVSPADHVVSQFTFDVCISADGRRNTMPDFKRKEFRGKLAIAITANFINHKTKAEASVEEISGVSYIFNQKFFKDLSQETGIDLENIVYYKDETHYFVMTAKKHNLLIKKVLLQDFDDPEMLLSSSNVDQQALLSYAVQAAEFSTNYKLKKLEFAHNQYGQPDVSMFDFTSMFAAENACRVVERQNYKLLLGLVGDTLLEPFWPTGSGCARGFLSALDAAWMVRSWSLRKMSVLHIVAERESIYQLLSQTTSENLNKNYSSYSIDPSTRYMNLNLNSMHPEQIKHLFDGTNMERGGEFVLQSMNTSKFKQYDMCEKYKLMRWCQQQLETYENLIRVVDMYSSWKNGIALSALIHRYRPDLIDVYSLDGRMTLQNIRNAMKILEKEFGVVPEFAAEDILTSGVQVENLLTSYLLQFREAISNGHIAAVTKSQGSVKDSLLSSIENKVSSNDTERGFSESKDNYIKSLFHGKNNLPTFTDKTVSAIAQNLSMKVDDKSENIANSDQNSNICHACRGQVYLVQRLIAEGLVFHRNCFRCSYCLTCLHKDYYALYRVGEENQFFCKHHYGLRRPSPVDNVTSNMVTNSLKDSNHSKPKHRPAKKTKISERAEYTTESEMGENEDDQTRHNLIGLGTTQRSETDFSTSEEELQFLVDDVSEEEPDFAWAQIAKLCSVQSDEKIRSDSVKFSKGIGTFELIKDKIKTTSIVSLDSTSEADTVGGSDADWETDTEIEIENTINEVLQQSSKEVPATNPKEDRLSKAENMHSSTILRNRMAFFSAPAQPVRIDARTFFGLDKIGIRDQEDTNFRHDNRQTNVRNEEVVADTSEANKESTTNREDGRVVDQKNPNKKFKLKSKKLTKKRKKDEKARRRGKNDGTWTGHRRSTLSNGCSSGENYAFDITKRGSSPLNPTEKKRFQESNLSRDTPRTCFSSGDETLRRGTLVESADIIEKMQTQVQQSPCLEKNIVQLSSGSDVSLTQDLLGTNNDDVRVEEITNEVEQSHPVNIDDNATDDDEFQEDKKYNVSIESKDETILTNKPQIIVPIESSNIDDNSSSPTDINTIIEPCPNVPNNASSLTSLTDVTSIESNVLNRGDDGSKSCDVENIEESNYRRLSFRSTSYDSCLKLAAAIESLFQDNFCDENMSPPTNNVVRSSVENSQENSEPVKSDKLLMLASSENLLNKEIAINQGKSDARNSWLSAGSITSSKSLMSPNKFIDAKRRFFCEPPQPLRIDHIAFFGDLSHNQEVPRSEISPTSGEITLSNANDEVDSSKVDDPVHISPLNDKKQEDATTSFDDVPSSVEIYFNVSKSRVEISENKSLKSNKLLGQQSSPFDSTEEMKQYSGILNDQQNLVSPSMKENYFSDPETSYKVRSQNDSNAKDSVEMRKKNKNNGGGKDKRRSFLSKIIQIKHEKKDKSSNSAQPKKQTDHVQHLADQNLIKEKTNSLPLDKRKQNKRKIFDKGTAFKSRSQGSKNGGIGQSVYEEMAPIMEGIKKVQQRNKEKNNIKERVQVIAPALVKVPNTSLIPPKADIDDFETESELGDDRLSLWSLHSQNEKLQNISEEENSKQRKKQLRMIRRKHKEKEMSRMHTVQEIMRDLEEIEIQQQQVEERGVQIERILRGERTEQERLLDEVFLIQEWFNAIQEKNFLNRHESELIVQTRELELEDKQCQLQLQLQEIMFQDDIKDKTKEQERQILQELVDVVEKRDRLVSLLEEERLKHKQYDRNLQKIMEERGFLLNTSLSISTSHENTFS